MTTNNFLDQAGLGYLWMKIADEISIKASATEKKIPSKVSQLENDKEYIAASDIPTNDAISAETIQAIVNGTYL